MRVIGYNRVSTSRQNLDRGDAKIQEFCATRGYVLHRIYADKQTGRNFERPRYIVMKEDVLQEGDILIIPEADRLGRNKNEIVSELRSFQAKGVRVMILDIPTTLMDLSGLNDSMSRMVLETVNNLLIEMYALMAQTELEKLNERRRQGIEAMKQRGDWDKYGRKRKMDQHCFDAQYLKVVRGETTAAQLARDLNLSASTFYRYVRRSTTKKRKETKE